MALGLHVDEVDDDQTGEIAQPQLASSLIGRFQVGAERGFLDVAFPSGTAGVHVDRDQRFGLVDHQITAGAQLHDRLQHGVELSFHLAAREQRLRIAPQLHLLGVGRHQHAHEIVRGAPAVLAVHQNFVDVAGVDVADRPLDEAGFLVNQRRGRGLHRQVADVVPQAQQIFAVAADLRLRTLGTGCAHDQAHPLRDVQLGHHFLQAATVGGGGNLAGNPAAPRRIRHQHGETAGERQIRRQRGALGTAFFLDDLDQQDLAAVDDFLNFVMPHEAGLRPALAAFLGRILLATDGFRRGLVGVFVVGFKRVGRIVGAGGEGFFRGVGERRGGIERVGRGFSISR